MSLKNHVEPIYITVDAQEETEDKETQTKKLPKDRSNIHRFILIIIVLLIIMMTSIGFNIASIAIQSLFFINFFKFYNFNIYFSIEGEGCHGQANKCDNNGTCLPNGHCQCKSGFNGLYCSNCIYYAILKKSFITYKTRFFQDNGCNFGGVFTCLNDGQCLSNGSCECTLGFSGITCLTCMF